MGINDFISSNDVKLDSMLKFSAEIDKMTAVFLSHRNGNIFRKPGRRSICRSQLHLWFRTRR